MATSASSTVNPIHIAGWAPPSANTRAATRNEAAITETAGQQVSAPGRRKMEYGLSARTSGWLHGFSLGWFE